MVYKCSNFITVPSLLCVINRHLIRSCAALVLGITQLFLIYSCPFQLEYDWLMRCIVNEISFSCHRCILRLLVHALSLLVLTTYFVFVCGFCSFSYVEWRRGIPQKILLSTPIGTLLMGPLFQINKVANGVEKSASSLMFTVLGYVFLSTLP